MRVLGVLAAWGVLAVLATLCFAVGGSIGYRRGVQDAVRQLRERRNGKADCRPIPSPHHRHRRVTRIRLRSAVRPLHGLARTAAAGNRPRTIAGVQWSPAVIGALVAVCLLAVPGIALGAAASQPGETLWHVKRGIEQARLVMAIGPNRDAVIHADLAGRRLTELNQLLSTDGADPQVVDMVITSLRDHTESATIQLKETALADRQAVAEHLDDLVTRQITAIDLLLGIDCTDGVDQQCAALTDTREVSEELQRTTTAIAAAETVPGGMPEVPAMATEDVADVGTEAGPSEASAAVSAPDVASEAASDGSNASPSPASSEDSSATPAPGGDTSTPETAADEASSAPSDADAERSSPQSGDAAESTETDKAGSEFNADADAAESADDELTP